MPDVPRVGRADLHMHTTVSDGTATVKELLNHLARRKSRRQRLDVIAITDHDRLSASLWAYEHQERYPFEIVPGLEVSSAGGHILALWVTRPIPARMSVAETVAAIHEQNGIAVLAHPFHLQLGFVARHIPEYLLHSHRLKDWGLDALEVHNAGIMVPFCNLTARHVARKINLPTLGNSDAHTVGAVGSGYTLFPGKTAADLRIAIENGLTVAKGGAWGLKEYFIFIRDMIERRGKHWTEIEGEIEPDVPVAQL